MANTCNYRFLVQGQKNACYAFLGSVLDYDGEVVEEGGTEREYFLTYAGGCAWAVDARCETFTGETPVEIPSDPKDAFDYAISNYIGFDTKSRSAMFQVEVYCIADPGDDVYRSKFVISDSFHYISGKDAPMEAKWKKYLRNLNTKEHIPFEKYKHGTISKKKTESTKAKPKAIPETKQVDPTEKETFWITCGDSSITAERFIIDGEQKKKYKETDGIWKLLAKATKIDTTQKTFNYALKWYGLPDEHREIAYRYLLGQLEIVNLSLDALVKKHREKLMKRLIVERNYDVLKRVILMSRGLKPVDWDEMIILAEKSGDEKTISLLNKEKQGILGQ